MKKTIAILMVVAFTFQACYTLKYTDSGQTINEPTRVLYIIGLVPLGTNNFKSGKAYQSQMNVVDWLITAVTFNIVHSRTVTPLPN
jgi:hypothetical protein